MENSRRGSEVSGKKSSATGGRMKGHQRYPDNSVAELPYLTQYHASLAALEQQVEKPKKESVKRLKGKALKRTLDVHYYNSVDRWGPGHRSPTRADIDSHLRDAPDYFYLDPEIFRRRLHGLHSNSHPDLFELDSRKPVTKSQFSYARRMWERSII